MRWMVACDLGLDLGLGLGLGLAREPCAKIDGLVDPEVDAGLRKPVHSGRGGIVKAAGEGTSLVMIVRSLL